MAPAYISPMSPTSSYSYSNSFINPPSINAPQPSARMFPRRSMKPSMLPDIAETSPIQPPVERPIRNVRPQSLQSLLSVGTIEVDGFGFLEEEDGEDGDDSWDTESLSPSMYESSIYDGHEGHGNEDGRVTPSTLSRRAEKVLENAKKKLDLCGQNLTRARHSLIISPPGSSLSKYSDPDSERISTPRTLTPTNLSVTSRTGTPTNRASTPTNAPVPLSVSQLRMSNNTSHVRTVSEGAVPTVYNLQRANSIGRNSDDGKEEPERWRSQSAQQIRSSVESAQHMRSLRDQMKDLRGKISSLQQQSRTESLKRMTSNSSRSSPVPFHGSNRNTPTPTSSRSTPTWEIDDYMSVNGPYTESVVSSRSSTPKPKVAVRESRHEDREDAFSYDSLFIGNGIYAPRTLLKQTELGRRSDSRGSFRSTRSETLSDRTEIGHNRDSPTLGHHDRGPSPVVLRRLDSFTSVSSYATADDGGYRSSPTGSMYSSSSGSSRRRAQSSASTARNSPKIGSSPNGEDRIRDDGYHSAPHTPRGSENQKESTSRPAIAPSGSSSSPSSSARGSFLLPPTPGGLSRRGSRIMSGSAGIEISGHIATTGANDGDISLQLALEDRLLVERLIEELGKTCCAMEVAKAPGDVAALRKRLEIALQVLEG